MIKNLIICGDSVSSVSFKDEYKGTHWSELLSKNLNLNLINLAYRGCSNRMVVFQILESLNYTESLVIAMPSDNYFRFDILTNEDYFFTENITLKNFYYKDRKNFDLEKKFIHSINAQEFNKNKEFLLKKIPWGLYKEIDKWGLIYSLLKLKNSKNPFLFLDGIYHQNQKPYDLIELLEFIEEKNILKNSQLCFSNYIIDKNVDKWFEKDDPGYHTYPKEQLKIASIIKKEILDRGLLL